MSPPIRRITAIFAVGLLSCGDSAPTGAGGTSSTTQSATVSASTSTTASSVSSSVSSSGVGSGGAGGQAASSSSASTGSSGGCLCLDTAVCDCDSDGHERYDPAHGCTAVSDAMGDCDDCNSDVFPGQTAYFTSPTIHGFDYDCSGSIQPKYLVGSCGSKTGLAGCSMGVLEAAAQCGQSTMLDSCKADVLPISPCIVSMTSSVLLPCH